MCAFSRALRALLTLSTLIFVFILVLGAPPSSATAAHSPINSSSPYVPRVDDNDDTAVNIAPPAFPIQIDSETRALAYMRFIDYLTDNSTTRDLLYQSPVHLPPSFWRKLAFALGDPSDGLPPDYVPGQPLETPEQANALRAERAKSASNSRFAMLRSLRLSHVRSHRGNSSSSRSSNAGNSGTTNSYSADHDLYSRNTGTFFPAAHQMREQQFQQPQQQPVRGFNTQAAAGGRVYGYRVVGSVKYRVNSSTAVEAYGYHVTEILMSVECTACTSFLLYAGWAIFTPQITAFVDSPCTGAAVYIDNSCSEYFCFSFPAGLAVSSCPSTQYHSSQFWTSFVAGGASDTSVLNKPGCISDGRTSAYYASTVIPGYSIGTAVMTPVTPLVQYDVYQLSAAITSLGAVRTGTETSFILELSIRNIVARSLASIKAAHDSMTGYTYSTTVVDLEIDITTSSGAIISGMDYIAVGHTYIPFSAPLTESNEAGIASISLR